MANKTKTPKAPMFGKAAKGSPMPAKMGKMPKGKSPAFKMPKASPRGK